MYRKSKITAENHATILQMTIYGILFLLMLSSCHENAKEEKLNNKLIWSDTFEGNDLIGWKVVDEFSDEESNWFKEKGYLVQNTDCGNTLSLTGTNIIKLDKEFGNYVLLANLVCTDDDYIGILFRYKNVDNYYRFLLSSQREIIKIDKKVNGEFTTLAEYTEKEWEYVRFSVSILLRDDNIKIYLNNELFFDIKDQSFRKGKVGFTSISNLGSFFDDISIYSEYDIKTGEVKPEIVRGPYLQNVLENHAVIMWDTALPTNSVVEYGLTKKNTLIRTVAEKVIKHEVRLENLSEQTVYYYRISTNDVTSEWYSFKSGSERIQNFGFLVYGDTQLNFLRHMELAERMVKYNFDFILHAGDVVQRGTREDWDVEFFSPMKDILNSKPIYTAIGNHSLNSENYYNNFSNPALEHENYYSFQYGNCFFVVFDNVRAGYPNNEYFSEYARDSEQYKWLENELASDKAQKSEWLFVLSHIPSYIPQVNNPYAKMEVNAIPLFEKYDVDISFSGHLHGYARNELNDVTYIITAGGGGNQSKKETSDNKHYKNFQLAYNFIRIGINGKTLVLKAFDNKGILIDKMKLQH